ncbi:MAG: hypothetical protein L0226_14705 [Acidobacteria bacterium]|nr:hypothetical protein [Acidobacteriota bacterium]
MSTTRLIKKPAQPPPAQGRPPRFIERMEAAKTAFLSIPKYLADLEKVILAVQSKYPNLKICTFTLNAENPRGWHTRHVEVIGQCDALIIAIDSSRVLTSGVFRELLTAKRLGKLVSVFNASTGKRERIYGYQIDRERHVVTLKPKPEWAD